MTDNRTTELLCKLLDERGIEWKDGDAAYEIEWNTPDGRHCSAMYWKPTFTVLVSGCTPEQAIAATLGRPKAKAHPYGYEPDTGAFDCTRCECGCINDISAKYCNDCGGEIEIDMYAEKEIYHCPRHLVFAEKHDNGSLEFDGKRYIAATLGSDASAIRLAERLRGIADEMRSVGASSMSPHELLAFYAREVDKVADSLMFAVTLGSERHAYEQRITGDGSDWCEIMRSAYDDLMANACESCTPEQMKQLFDYIRAELGSGTCCIVKAPSDSDFSNDWRYRCSECGCNIPVNERDPETGDVINAANYCPNCGREVVNEC